MDDFSKGKLYLGADIDGYEAKEFLRTKLDAKGYLVIDLGVFDLDQQADYNDIAREVAEKVVENLRIKDNHDHGKVTLGILIAGDGGKMMASANQLDGAKAYTATKVEEGSTLRSEFGANILCLGTDDFGIEEISVVVDKFLV
jgi:RpiB/LacA/LacB family sugar-phosphate isomerase